MSLHLGTRHKHALTVFVWVISLAEGRQKIRSAGLKFHLNYNKNSGM